MQLRRPQALRIRATAYIIIPRRWMSSYNPSDFSFTSSGYTSSVESNSSTSGPLGEATITGGHKLTPRALKQHLDRFVVGQARTKRILSTAIYHHYKRIQQLRQREEEEEELLRASQAVGTHPVEDEFPGQQRTIQIPQESKCEDGMIRDYTPLTIEKSNVLCLGPTGVGKTLMLRTLARVLEVPFSMSDCTPFTQAGYVGEDADVCIHRLLAASNWDVHKAESGIVCLDEFDKIAKPKSNHGSKDISGEGVQQALLKIIEGTTLQINTKPERRPPMGLPHNPTNPSNVTFNPAGTGMAGGASGANTGKGETFTIDTSNILFIFTGAFIGMQKLILDRVAKGSIGFNAPVRGKSEEELAEDEELIKAFTPFFIPNKDGEGTEVEAEGSEVQKRRRKFNPLQLTEPGDLINFGLIPEIVGRIPVIAAVDPLDEEMMVRVLTEPRNALLKQYEQLFELSGVELRFTSPALREIAKAAKIMGTGARGLRTVMERLLSDAMFDSPGSSIKYVLITEAVAQRKQPPVYLARGQQHKFHAMIAAEEEEWAARKQNENAQDGNTFEEYGGKQRAAGFV